MSVTGLIVNRVQPRFADDAELASLDGDLRTSPGRPARAAGREPPRLHGGVGPRGAGLCRPGGHGGPGSRLPGPAPEHRRARPRRSRHRGGLPVPGRVGHHRKRARPGGRTPTGALAWSPCRPSSWPATPRRCGRRSPPSPPGPVSPSARPDRDPRSCGDVAESLPDLVVVDLQMGNMGGMAVCLELRLEASYGKHRAGSGAHAARPPARRVPGPTVRCRGMGGQAPRPHPAAPGDRPPCSTGAPTTTSPTRRCRSRPAPSSPVPPHPAHPARRRRAWSRRSQSRRRRHRARPRRRVTPMSLFRRLTDDLPPSGEKAGGPAVAHRRARGGAR